MPEKLPQGWVKTTLGEIRLDKSMGISQEQMRGETFELYSVPAFSEGKPEVVLGDTIGSNKILVSPGDVLLCKINPRINRAWVVGESHGYRQIASTEWIVFSKQEGISSDFLRYFFSQDSFRNYLAANVSGVGGSLMRVRPSVVGTYPFMLPPFAEQNRIVAKLNDALSGVERAERAAHRAQKRLQHYRAAVLDAAVTGELSHEWREAQRKSKKIDNETGKILLQRLLTTRRVRWEEAELQGYRAIGKEPKNDVWKSRYPKPQPPNTDNLPEIPEGWVWTTVDQLASLVTSGSRGWKAYYSEDGAIFIRSQDIRNDELNLTEAAHVRLPENSEGIRTQVSQDDLLVTITGANVGKAAIVNVELPEAYVSQHVGLIRFVNTQLTKFAHIYITAPSNGRKRLLESSYGAGKPGLNLDNLRELPIPVPPVVEQAEIVREAESKLSAAERLAASLKQQLARAVETRQSLLHEAFAGRLVPQDSNDEPASVLLERIRAAREAIAQKPKVKRMPKSKSTVTRRPLLDVLREKKVPMKPEQLFSEAGFKPSQVDLFYRELVSLSDKLQVKKPQASDAKAWPYRAHVMLQLKEN